ncbi:hypothetical protein [Paenibacillus sp. NPDC057934]|uniref:hypothetical protein n=1 Tax=Paenibacillus sp. NPDC057934 TaxID=3346282 RepID=UPI0036DB110C
MYIEELISKAATEGIVISKRQIQKYKELGLITSKSKGLGRKGREKSRYDEKALDTLKEIIAAPKIKQKHMIYYLLWMGHPVSWVKLQQSSLDLITHVESFFKKIVKETEDSHTATIAINEIARTSIPKQGNGRPSKKKSEEILAKETEFARMALHLIHEMTNGQHMSLGTFENFFTYHGATLPENLKGSIANTLQDFSLKNMRSELYELNERDFGTLPDVISCLKEYWNELKRNMGDPDRNLAFQMLLGLLNRYYPGGFKTINIPLIQYLVLVYSFPLSNRSLLIEHLRSDETKQVVQKLCQFLSMYKSEDTEPVTG